MQIKQQIEQLLSSAGLWPKKRLGQNFLIDLNLMRLLIDTANINGQDVALDYCSPVSLSREPPVPLDRRLLPDQRGPGCFFGDDR